MLCNLTRYWKHLIVKHIETEEESISEQLSELNHKKSKFDQELDKYYDVSLSREYKRSPFHLQNVILGDQSKTENGWCHRRAEIKT